MGRTKQAMSPVFWGEEPAIADDPFDEPPYQVADTFYCNACKAYSKEFYPSAIARRMRECRPCKNKKRKSRVQSHLSKLRSRLFKAFNRRGFKSHRTVFQNKSSLVELIRARLVGQGHSRDYTAKGRDSSVEHGSLWLYIAL